MGACEAPLSEVSLSFRKSGDDRCRNGAVWLVGGVGMCGRHCQEHVFKATLAGRSVIVTGARKPGESGFKLIRLLSASEPGRVAARVWMPPYETAPDVVMWGPRVFRRVAGLSTCLTEDDCYVEARAHYVSPGYVEESDEKERHREQAAG